jgi:hypothetical protein
MKIIRTAFVLFALAIVAIMPLVAAVPTHQFKQLKLEYTTTDPDSLESTPIWQQVPGNEISDFKLKLDPSIPYYYLDIMKLKPFAPIANGYYGFTLDYANLKVDSAVWETFWASKGAKNGGADWEQLLYNIAHGTAPIFYLKFVVGDKATVIKLVDGFWYQISSGAQVKTLRVDGSYPPGTYTYTGTIVNQDLSTTDIVMQITFK